jgi:lysozyme
VENVELRKQLGLDEGRVRYAYTDNRPQRYLTIGIGRLIDKRLNGGLYEDEIDLLFDNDLQRKVEDMIDRKAPWLRTLDSVRLGAFKNMIFQMGIDRFLGFTNSLALARAARWDECSRNILLSNWAQQTPGRAHRIADQLRTGVWQYATN